MALPINKAILEPAKMIWHTVATCAPTLKRTEEKYFVPSKQAEYLISQPTLNSLELQAVIKRNKQYHPKLMPTDETKHLDLFGRKNFTKVSLQFYIAHYQALVSK